MASEIPLRNRIAGLAWESLIRTHRPETIQEGLTEAQFREAWVDAIRLFVERVGTIDPLVLQAAANPAAAETILRGHTIAFQATLPSIKAVLAATSPLAVPGKGGFLMLPRF